MIIWIHLKVNSNFALSETWLNQEIGIDFHIEGYELHYIN